MDKSSINLQDFLNRVYVPSRIDLCMESIRQMEISIRLLERWYGSPVTLTKLSEELLRNFLSEYRKTHSAATTNSKRCQLLAVWNCAWEEEYLESPPRSNRIRRARTSARIPEAWSAEEVSRVIRAATALPGTVENVPASLWWRSLLMVMYDTGERRKAILSVRPTDLSIAGGWIVFTDTKTKAPRWCPISSQTCNACLKMIDTNQKYIWSWPYSREWMDQTFRRILQIAGVAYGRDRGGLFHKLRRTSGTLVESHGGDGAKHIGDTRKVFDIHYRDPRFFDRSNLDCLPRVI